MVTVIDSKKIGRTIANSLAGQGQPLLMALPVPLA